MASLFKKKTVDGKFFAAALRACLFVKAAQQHSHVNHGLVSSLSVNLFNIFNLIWGLLGHVHSAI